MLFITIISIIVAKALPVLNTQITSSQLTRITTISLIFSGLISLNCLNLETIGSGIGIYSGLFHITQISQIFEIFIYLIGGLILMGWNEPSLPVEVTGEVSPSLPLLLPSLPLKKKAAFAAASHISERAVNAGHPRPSLNKQSDYSIIVLFSILGSSLLISSFDLISIYLSIELQSFGLYVLSTLYKDSESSTSSGLKYFLLGGLSSCIILLGIGLIYSYTGITNLESLYLLNTVTFPHPFIGDLDSSAFSSGISVMGGLSLGLILIFVGFLFKIAASPLHNWSPDVYDGVPTIVTSYLTIIPKISILILLLELQIQIGSADAIIGSAFAVKTFILEVPVSGNAIKSLLLISSLLSLIIGSLLGLAQIRIKRLLAYSTISHIGFLLLALGINTEQSIDSFLFYIIVYTITNLNIFLIILALTRASGGNTQPQAKIIYPMAANYFPIADIRYLSEFKGLFFSNPFLSLSLAVSLFSMAGIPPLIGFFSKQFVLYSALQNGYYFISILAIIVSVISASYYLKIVKLLVESSEKADPIPALSMGGACNAPIYTGEHENSPALSGVLRRGEPLIWGNAKIAALCGKVEPLYAGNVHSYLISILTVTILLFFQKPSIILNSSKLLTLSLFSI